MSDYAIKFGKYQGELIGNVPRSYLNWCLEEIEDDGFWILSDEDKTKFEEAIEEEFNLRNRSHITF